MDDPPGLSELRELLWAETLSLMLGRNLGGEEGMGKSFFPHPGWGAIAELISDRFSAFADLILFSSQGNEEQEASLW